MDSVRSKIFFLIISIMLISFSALAATVNVSVGSGGVVFSPSDVTINVGDTIQWNWATNGHSTTSTTAIDGCITGGTDPWDSTVLPMGSTFSKTFNTIGDYPYKCTPHCMMGMRGVVRVVDFDIACLPSTISAAPNTSGTSTCTVTSLNNFNSAVDLSISGLPAGVTGGFSADPVTPPAGGSGTSTLTLNVGAMVAPGSYPFTVSGQNGDRIKTINLTLAVPLFVDNFEDADVTDWTFLKGTWNVVSGSLVGTHDRKATGQAPYQMAEFLSVEALVRSAGGPGSRTSILGWVVDKKTLVEVLMKEEEDRWVVKQRQNGTVVSKGKVIQTILPNTDYRVQLKMDQITNQFQLFIDGVMVLQINAFSTGMGTPGVRVKATTSTFGEILVY